MLTISKQYIEREALIAAYDAAHKGPPGGARKLMEDAPAADVVEVKHGRWEFVDFVSPTLKCSVCGGLAPMDCCGDYHRERTDYCPNCGAKMDGE